MLPELIVLIVFALIIGAGLIVVFSSLWHRARILEMAHRERLAMIERGIALSEIPPLTYQDPQLRRSGRSSRLLSAGIVIVGLGLAVALLIGFASRAPEIALGVGGAIVVLGVSLIVTAIVVRGGSGPEFEPPPGSPRDDRSFPKPPPI
jgi:peptidoglycan/LPS O-acetylase OafA/YrhL